MGGHCVMLHSYQINAVQFSPTGDAILVCPGSSQVRLLGSACNSSHLLWGVLIKGGAYALQLWGAMILDLCVCVCV